MNAKQNRQSGFSVVEGLLVLIVLLLVGFIGYYIYQSNNNALDTYGKADDSALTTPKKTSDASEIKTAVLAYKDNAEDKSLVVTIEHSNETYALGTVAAANGDGGASWFAKKVDGEWTVLSQGADGHCDELAAAGLTAWDTTCKQ